MNLAFLLRLVWSCVKSLSARRVRYGSVRRRKVDWDRATLAQRDWALEDENRKLKKLLVESTLDQAALKELLTKKW